MLKKQVILTSVSMFIIFFAAILSKTITVRYVDENGASINFDKRIRAFKLVSVSHYYGYKFTNIKLVPSKSLVIEQFSPKRQPLSIVKRSKYIGVTFQPTIDQYSKNAQKDPFILSRKYNGDNSGRDTLRVLVGNKFDDCRILSANYPAISIRDPSITKIGHKYFIIYTRGLITTEEFNHWKKIPWPKDKDFNYNQDWAPEFVNTKHVIMSKTHSDYYHHQLYLTTFQNATVGRKWDKLIGDFPQNVIDPHLQKVNRTYYLFFKDETKQKIMMGTSKNVLGPYKTKYLNIKSPFYGVEGPEALYEHGRWLLYFDTINISKNHETIYHGLFYTTSKSLNSWSKLKRLNHQQVLRHGELISNR